MILLQRKILTLLLASRLVPYLEKILPFLHQIKIFMKNSVHRFQVRTPKSLDLRNTPFPSQLSAHKKDKEEECFTKMIDRFILQNVL